MNLDRIGFVGLGNMGRPMAGRLMAAGHSLVVFDINRAAVDSLAAKGAEAASSPRAVADRTELVLISLPTPEIVRQVCFGEDGLAAGSAVKAVCDLSTTGPQAEAAIAGQLSSHGIELIDCPVSGGVGGAVKGTLAMMAATRRTLFDEIDPILAHIGKRFFVGETPGLGQSMKLVNNIVSVGALAITSEAMALGSKSGLDADTMIEVLNAGSGRTSASVDKIPNFVMTGGFDFGFAIGLSAKDVRLCLEEAEARGVPMPVANAVRTMTGITRARYGDGADMTAIMRIVEDWAGVEVRRKAT